MRFVFLLSRHRLQRDSIKWLVYALIVLFVYGFTYMQMANWQQALSFTASIAGSFIDTYRHSPCTDVDGKAFLSFVMELFMEAGTGQLIPAQ